MACRYCGRKFALSDEGREWFSYAEDRTVTLELIEEIAAELSEVLGKFSNWRRLNARTDQEI